jgi:hypothetical protein
LVVIPYNLMPGSTAEGYEVSLQTMCGEIEMLRLASRPTTNFFPAVKSLSDPRIYALRTLNRFSETRPDNDPVDEIADSSVADLWRRHVLNILRGHTDALTALPANTILIPKATESASLCVQFANSNVFASADVEAAFGADGRGMILYSYTSDGDYSGRFGGFLVATKLSANGPILPVAPRPIPPGMPY